MVYNDKDDRARLSRYVPLSKRTNTHTHTHTHKPGPMHAHHTEAVTVSERREGAYGVVGRIGVGGGNRDRYGVGGENRGVNGDGDRTGTETRSGVDENKYAQHGNGDGNGDGDGDGGGDLLRNTGLERERERRWEREQ